MGGEHSRKEPFEQLVNSYSEHLHMSARPVENAHDNTYHKISRVETSYGTIHHKHMITEHSGQVEAFILVKGGNTGFYSRLLI